MLYIELLLSVLWVPAPVFRNPRTWIKKGITVVEEDQVREYLSKLGINKSIGPDGMQPCLMEIEQLILETISRLMKEDRKVIRSRSAHVLKGEVMLH